MPGNSLQHHSDHVGLEPELSMNHFDEDTEYPSSGSEYHKRSYQNSVVKQTNGGKIHVTVTYPTASSTDIPPYKGYDYDTAASSKRTSPVIRSVSNLSHHQHGLSSSVSLDSQPKTCAKMENMSRQATTSVTIPNSSTRIPSNDHHHKQNPYEDMSSDEDRVKVNNNNITTSGGKQEFQEGNNMLDGACGSVVESQCFKRDLHVKQHGGTSEQSNGDLVNQGMDTRRLTVDSGICLCGHDNDLTEKHSTNTISASKPQQSPPVDHSQ